MNLLAKMIERMSDKEFWQRENLKTILARPHWGAVLALGFERLLVVHLPRRTEQYRDANERQNRLVMATVGVEDKVEAALWLRRATAAHYATDEDCISVRDVLKAAHEIELINQWKGPTLTTIVALSHDGILAAKVEEMRLIEEGTAILKEAFAS